MLKASFFSLFSLILACFAMTASLAKADSWPMPRVETTASANKQFRFTVTPAPIDSQLDYFSEEAAAAKSGKPVERPAPIGLLERRDPRGTWEPVWTGPLVNPVAPVNVLVADDGRYVVTFDNWHSLGYGAQVIVIYGPDGKLVRSMSLTDLVPQDYIEALPHTVSSISWSEDESFSPDGASVIVHVLVPRVGEPQDEADTVPVTIALADGAVTPPPPDAWQAARASAAKVSAFPAEAEAKRIAYLTDPLTPPQGCMEPEWHEYLREAYARLSPKPPFDASAWTNVLFPRAHSRHRESVGWLKEEMLGQWEENDVAVASPCDPDGLVATVGQVVKKARAGRLANLTLYVSAPEAQFTAIARLVAPTGGRTVWLDPAQAIPQRPDRIPGSPEQQAAMEAHMNALDEEMAQERRASGSDQQMP